ncbi:SH3 domain-containing protein [Rhizobium sp. BK008]|uniref:SH3 domain-containing protein n=1 Tax=Rhizobium sp. BK008 TaxID=2587094 RepID=UPI0018506764|nr:SH3-like domain-containing protein [Rhizobium sp. BK008]
MPRRRGSSKTPKFGGAVVWLVLVAGVLGSLFSEKATQPTSAPPIDQSPPLAGGVAQPRDLRSTSLEEKADLPSATSASSLLPQKDRTGKVSDATLAKIKEPAKVEKAARAKPTSAGQDTEVSRFIKGRRVALRDGPGKQFGILDRYDARREVTLLGSDGEWSQIKDKLTQREGWVFTNFLSEQEPAQQSAPEDSQPKMPTISNPQISDATIVQRIIAQSLSLYPGSCPCPYNTDRAGRSCGKRSAYNRGGGYAPLCFAGDVSRDMITAFRSRH